RSTIGSWPTRTSRSNASAASCSRSTSRAPGSCTSSWIASGAGGDGRDPRVVIERIALLAPEPIPARMAGMGIRALELARALSGEFAVRLLVPNDVGEAHEAAGGVEVARAAPGTDGLAAAARWAQAGIVSGHAATGWFQEVPELPVAADLYD